MDTVMDTDMLTVPYMDLENRVSQGTTFLKATLFASESPHLMAIR